MNNNLLLKLKQTLVIIYIILTGLFIISSCNKDEVTNIKIQKKLIKNPVSNREANDIAIYYAELNSTQKNSSNKIKSNFSYIENDEEYLHIFSYETGGFIIVSGSQVEYPVLAKSSISSINKDSIPYGLQLWMKTTAENIRLLETGELTAPKKIKNDIKKHWLKYSLKYLDPYEGGGGCGTNTYTKGPLVQSEWKQYDQYNALCPLLTNGTRAYAGCVTIAMAQIMYYHKHPSWYSWNYPYMKDLQATNESALLISDIFDQVITDYDETGSSSNANNAVDAFEDIFNYTASKINYDKNDDFNIIKTEIDANRPVYLDGNEYNSLFDWPGHAWICDGYELVYNTCGPDYKYLYMNWGWADSNGFFSYNDWTVTRSDGSVKNYQYFNNAIINIKPN
ncbi:MAG: C10 family peptidase [Bacteroidales bacterium]|nr:C10 family peptidase [Bacteroidales bacterium]